MVYKHDLQQDFYVIYIWIRDHPLSTYGSMGGRGVDQIRTKASLDFGVKLAVVPTF